MNTVLKAMLILATAFVALVHCDAAEGGEVLWWMVGDGYESIEGTTSQNTTMTAGELGVTDARIRYESESGEKGYLTLYGLGSDGSVNVLEGAAGVGLPAEYFADLSSLSGTGYSFVLELGNYVDGSWVHTSMESTATYVELSANRHITKWESTAPSYGTPWKPTSFTVVPEPSSGLMLLVGGALLALRRRRFSKGR